MNKTPAGSGARPHAGYAGSGLGRRLVTVLTSALLVALVIAGPAGAAPGDLDPSFGGDGKATTDLGHQDEIRAIAIQPDGKIVAAGSSLDKDTNVVVSYLARYKPDGTLDAGFGSGGTVSIPPSALIGVEDLVLQDDGKIVVVGFNSSTTSYSNFALVRYNPDGSPDDGTSQDSTPGDVFGTNGTVTTSLSPRHDHAYAAAVQKTDGKIVVAGYAETSLDSFGNRYGDFAVARYNPNGTLDTTFDGDGWVATNASASNTGFDGAYDVVIQSDGRIVAAGESRSSGSTDFTLLRYNADGSLDDGGQNDSTSGDAFGTGGKAIIQFGRAYALAVQPDGKILAAGAYNGDFLLARYASAGTLDSTFGASGTVSTGFDAPGGGSFGTYDVAESVAVQSDGRIIVAGTSEDNSTAGGLRSFALARYRANGDPDTTFSDDGKLATSFTGSSDDAAHDLAIQPDGKPVAGGTSNGDFALARYFGGDDATPPTVSAPVQGLISGSTVAANTSSVPIRLSWSGNDTQSGISRYQLQQKTGAGPYTDVPLSSMKATTKTLSLSPGRSYRFRVRALDENGNWSAWKAGPGFTVVLRQESGAGVSYPGGKWKLQNVSGACGGALKYETARGAKARFTFMGRSVAWVATKSPTRGKAEVWLDGVKRATVDLRSATTQRRKLVFVRDGLNPSVSHKLEIKVLGTAGRPRVDVDAFVVLR